MRAHARLLRWFHAGLAAVDSGAAVRAQVRRGADGRLEIAGRALPPGARVRLIASGKAAGAMARAFEEVAEGDLAAGLCVTKQGHAVPLARIESREAAHPVPDASGESAARACLALAASCAPEDVLVVLLSGGSSALLACPAPGVPREALAAATELLLRAGAPIEELNAVRKHLSGISGGRLAARTRARRIEVLAVSDVVGDRLDVIGSGPCHPDPTTYADALRVLALRGLLERVPAEVRAHLEAGARGLREETPKPGDPALARVCTTLVATNRTALQAVELAASRDGVASVRVTDRLAGEARQAGARFAALARCVSGPLPRLLLAGGETTVRVRGPGRGGRSQELALAAAIGLAGVPGVTVLAAGTDGTDGPTDAAGAWVDGDTVARGARAGVGAGAALEQNDAYGFFSAEGGLVRIGPTSTNVMDLVLALWEPPGPARADSESDRFQAVQGP